MLHPQHLFFCVGVISDVNKFCHLWGVDLLKLPTVKQRSVSMEIGKGGGFVQSEALRQKYLRSQKHSSCANQL